MDNIIKKFEKFVLKENFNIPFKCKIEISSHKIKVLLRTEEGCAIKNMDFPFQPNYRKNTNKIQELTKSFFNDYSGDEVRINFIEWVWDPTLTYVGIIM